MKIQWFSWWLAALLTAPMLPAEDVPAQDSGFTVLHKDRKNSPEDVIERLKRRPWRRMSSMPGTKSL